MKQYADLDFSKAAKILNVLVDPVASDDTGLGTGQMWFNTTSKFFKGYDGTTKFQLLRDDLAATITGVFTFNPSSGSVPFAVHSSKTGVVTYLNADEVDGYDAAEAATASTLAARDASGNLTVATPTSDGHAATKAYVDSIAAGQDWKDSCLVATTANITLSGTQTIDGVAVVADDRVLVKDQTTASENGIYVCAAGAWSRAADADENSEVTSGLTTYIEQGTDNAGAGYTLTTSGAIVVGTTALTFTRTSGGSVYSDGNGMVKSGTTFHFAQAASYTAGGLPYASGASTIGFIAAVDSGKVLKSNGTGTAPLWASLDLTADVGSSILPVANGGTGTSTQFTQGSVVFAGASGVYAEDSTGLFFDATNIRLGIGTSSANYTLDVAGTGRVTGKLGVGNSSRTAMLDVRSDTGEAFRADVAGGAYRIIANQTGVNFQGTVNLATLAASSSDSVLTQNSGNIEKRTIDSRVWGSSLVDGSGSSGYIPLWSDSNTVGDSVIRESGGDIGIGKAAESGWKLTANGSIRSDAGSGNVSFGMSGWDVLQWDNTNEVQFGGVTAAQWQTFTLHTAGAEALRVNAARNFGFGTTDIEAWNSSYRAIEFPQAAIMFGNSSKDTYYLSNVYYDGAWKYKTTSHASMFYFGSGGTMHYRVAGSGTIDTVITWTSAIDIANSGAVTLGVIGSGSGSSVLTEESGVIKKRTIYSGCWTGDSDTVDGYEASALLDLFNSTGDTDDISEGLTNLFYTDARARGALSSTDSAEIAYNNTTGILGLGTEAGRVKSGTIGDGASTSLTFTHNLGTRNVHCQVFRTGTPYDTIMVDVERNTTNQVTVGPFDSAPSSGEYTVVCVAANG